MVMHVQSRGTEKPAPLAVTGVRSGDKVSLDISGSSSVMTPSDYGSAPSTLTTTGVSLGAMATGATLLSLGLTAAAATPVVIGFGVDATAALAAVDATAGAEVGHMLALSAVGDVDKVGIPSSLGTNPFAAMACLTASGAKVMTSQGV